MQVVGARLIILLIACFLHDLARRFKFPYTILLFISGVGLGGVNSLMGGLLPIDIQLTPQLLFFVLLPVLIFESGYDINYAKLSKNYLSIWSLATVGVVVCAGLIGLGVWRISGALGYSIPLAVTLLLGIIISATDPVAVLSLFKNLGVPKRLRLIFEGESLFNDGTAIALFLVALAILTSGEQGFDSIFTGILQFFGMIIGGIIVGSGIGIIFSLILKHIHNNPVAEIGFVILLGHVVFFVAEYLSHFFVSLGIPLVISGVIACAYAAMVIGNYGKTKISPKVESSIHQFLDFFAFLSNGTIFLLMGLIVQQQSIETIVQLLPVMGITIICMLIARAISIYGTVYITNYFTSKPIPKKRQHTLVWGSLRGVVSLIMVLLIPPSLTVPGWPFVFTVQEFLLTITISIILFSLVIQGLSMKRLTTLLGLNTFHTLEEFEQYESEIIVYNRILEKIARMKEEYHITDEVGDTLENKYIIKRNDSLNAMEKFLSNTPQSESLIHQALALHALGIEKQYLKEMFRYNEVPENLYHYMMRKINVQESRVRAGFKQIRGFKKGEYIRSKSKRDPIIWLIDTLHSTKSCHHDSYIISRTRLIITSKVIDSLTDLTDVAFGYDATMLQKPIKLYEKFHYNAHREINYLRHKECDIVNQIESVLLNKGLAKTEEIVIKDLLHKDMITMKIYQDFMDEVEQEVMRKY